MLVPDGTCTRWLLVAVTNALEEAERAILLSWGTTAGGARRFRQRLSDPRLWPAERLFFELYVHALLARPGTEGFLDHAVEPWVASIAAGLATRDREGVTEAYEQFLRLHDAAAPDSGDAATADGR